MNATISLEHRKVLVLNKLWTAIDVATVCDAICLLFGSYKNGEPKAHVIDPFEQFQAYTWSDWATMRPKENENCITTSSGLQFRIPEVVLLTRYDKMPEQRVNFSRRSIYQRDNYRCQYCGDRPGTEELTIDHIVPRCNGGPTSWANCVLACVKCNALKANHTLKKCGLKLRKKPKKPRFNLFKGDRKSIPKSWEHFVSQAYWDVELRD